MREVVFHIIQKMLNHGLDFLQKGFKNQSVFKEQDIINKKAQPKGWAFFFFTYNDIYSVGEGHDPPDQAGSLPGQIRTTSLSCSKNQRCQLPIAHLPDISYNSVKKERNPTQKERISPWMSTTKIPNTTTRQSSPSASPCFSQV